MSIFDFFTREAGQERRRALEGLLTQFIPPEMRPQLSLLAEANPVVSMERAGQDAQTLFAPDQSLMDRLAAGGRMASNMAGVVAPAMVAGRAGVPVANAVQEVLTGYAPAVQPFLVDEFGGVGVPSFRAFHGSPHDFDRFDMSKIGTGEGAQAYGHGLYFAEAEDVAKQYRDQLSRGWKPSEDYMWRGKDAASHYQDAISRGDYGKALVWEQVQLHGTRDAIRQDLLDEIAGGSNQAKAALEFLNTLPDELFAKPSGRMYEVQINADPNDFLDFEAPWDAQPEAVKRHFSHLARGGRAPSGEDLAQRIESKIWAEEAAQAGIPGIRYLDAGSRGAGDGSRNYVVFDDKLIDIVRKYGIAGAAAMLGVSALDVEQAMAQGQQQPQGLLSGAQ